MIGETDKPTHWRRWFVACWAAVIVYMLYYKWNAIHWFALSDTDDNMRFVQVRALLEGQGWYDLRQHRINPPQGISIVAALALGVGGLAPGAIYAAAPHAAPAPSAVPPTIGLVQQASSLGQFAGPASLGLWVEYLGWQAAPAILAPAALLGLACAFATLDSMSSRSPWHVQSSATSCAAK